MEFIYIFGIEYKTLITIPTIIGQQTITIPPEGVWIFTVTPDFHFLASFFPEVNLLVFLSTSVNLERRIALKLGRIQPYVFDCLQRQPTAWWLLPRLVIRHTYSLYSSWVQLPVLPQDGCRVVPRAWYIKRRTGLSIRLIVK